MTYDKDGGSKTALMLQFRKKKVTSEPDLINQSWDQTLSNFSNSLGWKALKIP